LVPAEKAVGGVDGNRELSVAGLWIESLKEVGLCLLDLQEGASYRVQHLDSCSAVFSSLDSLWQLQQEHDERTGKNASKS
jgi:hypothetical protein